jgi:hypothetical protein
MRAILRVRSALPRADLFRPLRGKTPNAVAPRQLMRATLSDALCFPPQGGSHKSAQGNALGSDHINNRRPERAEPSNHLKGRSRLSIVRRRVAPIQGLVDSNHRWVTRALPWADLFRPLWGKPQTPMLNLSWSVR